MATLIWKPVGWTPLEVVRWYKEKAKIVDTVSYAGRLDPMAEGVLLLLVGKDNKDRAKYEGLPKTYEADIAWGVSTDTFDPLGIIVDTSFEKKPTKKRILQVLSSIIGKRIQSYPPYSSKAVGGKSLYWWARNNRLSEIQIPTREIEVFSVELLDLREMGVRAFVDLMLERIGTVGGDFRQKQIAEAWRSASLVYGAQTVVVSRLQISCGSGTYIRGIAHELGESLGCGAIAAKITRTHLGSYARQDCLTVA